jgi:single-strand DNA-binding protein
MNNSTLSGNVGRDPEIRFFESGSCKVTFSLAVYAGKKDGEVQTDWHNCEAWGKTAEAIAAHVRKGDRLLVYGALKVENYEKDGQKRKSYSFNIFDFGVTPKGGAPMAAHPEPTAEGIPF